MFGGSKKSLNVFLHLEQKDLPRDERWCRFENFAFANENVKNQHLLGSRGRGKFVFSGASDTMKTLYDTLRDDKVYRLGMRVVEKLDAPNFVAKAVIASASVPT